MQSLIAQNILVHVPSPFDDETCRTRLSRMVDSFVVFQKVVPYVITLHQANTGASGPLRQVDSARAT